MELLVGLAIVAVLLFWFFSSATAATKAPAKPTTQPVGGKARPQTAGSRYVRKNLSHLPPQNSASRANGLDASIYLHSDRWDDLLIADHQGLPNLYLQLHNGELWLTETTTGLLVSVANRKLRRLGIWTVRVRGVNYHEAAVRKGNFQPGAMVRLVREPDNAHDRNAVAIWAEGADEGSGYFNKGMAAGLSKLLDSGALVEAISLAGGAPGALGDREFNIHVLAGSPKVIEHLLRKAPLGGAA